uniref:LIM and calponin homology domains 1a n=1 Tax=Astyanax mexicanus TaxID=7994 RepID=A0A8B9HSP6_ASTMX
MASPNEEQQHQHEAGETSQEPAVLEAQKWIEAVTGRSFGEKDFRSGLANGILLCELLSSIKPGLVKKINRLPTPIAGLDNLTMFLRGCEELGLKGTQLFDPGDLQDTSTRANLTGSDLSRKLKNVLITIYWLGKTANSCTSYNGPTLDLKEFEGLLSMMRKECVSEESDSPKRNIRDSGYIDNWESERSDSLSPPRHGRDDSFDSLDSFGSRSQNTPSPDTVLRGNSDDSEGDGGSRRLPDVRKDDMSARRVSYKEPRAVVPFNQYLPNRSNQTNYIPAPLRKRRSEREEEWRSTSNATSPVSGEKPLREECVGALKEEGSSTNSQRTVTWAVAKGVEPELGEELKKIRKLEKAGIKVLPSSVRYNNRADPVNTDPPSVSHKEPTVLSSASAHSDDYDDQRDDEGPLPDLEKDDMLARRAVLHHKQSGSQVQAFNVFLPKPGAAKRKTATAGGQNQGSEKEKKPTAESAVTPPSADVHNTPEKGPQMLDRQEAGTEGVMGGRSAVLGGANAKSPSPKPDPTPRRPFWLEDDDLPPTFSHKAANVSDESESVSLIDMRDEEEVDTLSPHSQLRHERLHNQYNKLREEEDQWQDDLARWKNRRRSASQDLIKKEEERKMMEKLMLKEEGGPRRKSIKTYKEIVEEKERREHELHELYCTASTPEEKAAVLQRYALRFTISDAILEKLQLPKLPSASTPEITPSPTHSRQQTTYTLNEEAELPVDLQPALTLQHQTQPHQHMPQTSVHSLPKTPELIPAPVPKVPKVPKIPEVPHSPTRIPPPPSKPVPLLTPKPYSQPKLNQASHKSVKTDGLVRLNGECGVEETRETPAVTPVVRPVTFCPAPPKPPAKTHQQEPEVSPSSESIAPHTSQTLSTVSSQIKEETDAPCSPQEKSSEEETSSTLTHSEITEEKQTVSNTTVKRNCVIKTTIVTELTQIHPVPTTDMSSTDQLSSSDASAQKPSDEVSSADSRQADDMSQSLSLTDGLDFTSECIETPILNLAKRVDHWTWDPNEERKRQERWQQEQERLLQEKYQQEQERLKKEWEKAQKEVEEEERKHNEEERRILEETTTPLTPSISAQSPPAVTECPAVSTPPQDSVVLSLADWDKKREMLEKQQKNGVEHSTDQAEAIAPAQQNGQGAEHQESQSATPQLQFIQDGTWSSKSESRSEWKKTASLDRNTGPSQAQPPRMRRTGSYENILGTHSSNSPPSSQDTPPPSPSRSVSGKKLCSSCAHPLGKGAAMIIETLGLYFHIQCFKCGVCKGLLGDTSTGTDVRIRYGVLNCQDCYIKSRAAGQPTTL